MQTAIAERNEAMNRVEVKAEKNHPGWGSLAYLYLEAYARSHDVFYSFEVTALFREQGFVQPTTDRAWGPIYMMAVKNDLIETHPVVKQHPERHATKVLGWKSKVFKAR